MIVRLKGRHGILYAVFRRFQFYDSPIKRSFVRKFVPGYNEFQFYDSPIKRMVK